MEELHLLIVIRVACMWRGSSPCVADFRTPITDESCIKSRGTYIASQRRSSTSVMHACTVSGWELLSAQSQNSVESSAPCWVSRRNIIYMVLTVVLGAWDYNFLARSTRIDSTETPGFASDTFSVSLMYSILTINRC